MRVGIAQEIPRGARPLGHGIRLAFGRRAAARACGVHPALHLGKRALAGIGRLIVVHLRQQHRKLIFRHRHPAALLALDQRNRLAPVALAGEDPVAQLVIHLALADLVFHQPVDDGLFRLRNAQPVEEAAVAEHALLHVGIGRLLHVLAARNDLDDRQAELLGEIPVARIVRRNGHDRTRAVGRQHIVGDEHRDLAAVNRIDGLDALELHASLILAQLGALKIALARGGLAIGHNLVPVGDARLELIDGRMLRRDDHIGRAEERIRARGIHAELLVGILDGEIDLRALAAADPVALLHLHLVDEIHIVEAVEQLLRVSGDLEHPLALDAADDLRAAALALARHNLFVGQAALAARAPVDRHFGLIGQPLLIELQEDPLRPLEVVRVGGVDLARPVEGEADALELLAEVIDVLLRHPGGVDVVLDGIVLGRQAESVPADREEHVIALHAALAGDDVHCRVAARMADVQTRAGGIRELDQRVEFRLFMAGFRLKAMGVLPFLLPFQLNLFGIVGFAHGFFLLAA